MYSVVLGPTQQPAQEKLIVDQLSKKSPPPRAFYGTRRFIIVFTGPAPPLDTILIHTNPVHIITSYLHKIHFNIILSFTPRSLPFWFSN
jgi:hypothetical protein